MRLISKAEYEEEAAELEAKRKALRMYYLTEQTEQIPELRKIEGFEYMNLDNKLLAEIEDLQKRWKITKFVVSQGKPPADHPFRTIKPLIDQPATSSIKSTRCITKGCAYQARFAQKCSSCLRTANTASSTGFKRRRDRIG